MHKRAENMHKMMYIHPARIVYKNHRQHAQFICAFRYTKQQIYS